MRQTIECPVIPRPESHIYRKTNGGVAGPYHDHQTASRIKTGRGHRTVNKKSYNRELSLRRHLAMCFALTLVMAALFLFLLPGNAGDKGQVEATTVKEKYFVSIQVRPGDTLWDIAEEYSRDYQDYSEYIEEVRSVNQLSGDRITAGAYLFIPVYR